MLFSTFLTISFTMAAIIYALVVLYLFQTKNKEPIHWVFILMILGMMIWAESFAVISSTKDYAVASLWFRIASIGYGTSFCFLIHLALLISGLKDLAKNPKILFCLYLPGAVNVFIYAIGPSLGVYEQNIIPYTLGWVSASSTHPYDLFFYFFILIYTLVTFTLLIRWRLQSPNSPVRRQFKLTLFP